MKKSNYTTFFKDIKVHGVEYAVDRTVKLGFEAVEILGSARPSRWIKNREMLLSLKQLLAENQLAVSCYSAVVDLLSENADDVVEHALTHIEYAAEIGSPYFHHTLVPGLVMSSDLPSFDEAFERVIDNATKIATACNRHGIVCLYEPQGLYFNGVSGLKKLIGEVRKRGCNVGVCGDVGNSLFVDCQPVDIFKEFAADIRHVHVKDYSIYTEPCDGCYKSVGGKYLLPAEVGEGDIDIKSCLSCLDNYDGFISFEFEADDEEIKRTIARLAAE